MQFRASFCDPFQKDSINLGLLSKEAVISHFESIDWATHLSKMADANQEDIYFSPSLEIENNDTNFSLCFSAVGEPDDYEFYIFYKRPKTVISASGKEVVISSDYISDITGQTKQDAIDCLNAFIQNDTAFLENKIGAYPFG